MAEERNTIIFIIKLVGYFLKLKHGDLVCCGFPFDLSIVFAKKFHLVLVFKLYIYLYFLKNKFEIFLHCLNMSYKTGNYNVITILSFLKLTNF